MSTANNLKIIEQSERLKDAMPRLSDYMWKWVNQMPEHNAFLYHDVPITYKKFSEDVEQVAKYLLKLGVKKGDRVGYILTVRPEYNVFCLAASMIGAIGVGMNTRYTVPEMSYIMNHSRPRVVLALHDLMGVNYQERLSEVMQKTYQLEKIIVVGGPADLPNSVTLEEVLQGDYSEYNEELKKREAEVAPEDPLLIVYTSGSTGQPKGALLTHRSVICMCLIAKSEILGPTGMQPEDHILTVAPLNHVSGSVQWPLTAMVAGATQVPLDFFNPVVAMDELVKNKCGWMAGVPAMWEMMISLPDFEKYDLSHVRYALSGAGVPSKRVISKMISITPNSTNCLAMTELSGFVAFHKVPTDIESLSSTVGRVAPEIEMRIIDENGKEVPAGTTGELTFRGPTLFSGYFEMPEATAAAFDKDGWFLSGDLGFLDKNGNLHLVGRVKDMFKTGGYNVYPAEIEEKILTYPGVAMVAVVGMPHELMGEVGRAYIVAKPGVKLEGESIREYLKDHLADYKIPRNYVFREMLPMTNMGKIEKKYLRKEVEEEFAGK